ncbi:nucleotidyl transferase AbiEii/AbiGii toxin family protein [Chitinophaga sp. sic0106]|uniref:nucleotidyl transferase AbiEii/AbiGii toxin family protein n=1 Tax=Chitinophaga sp. sic0106 TaxID=2854785 RepID=UPI001C489C7E|nr:nucleotidyl transferase AbiEii/AbiGii toxin family protein [Chitinophaga sp. sic0106]
MAPNYLHKHKDFKDLLLIVSESEKVEPALVEKDYWIMHVLHGLKQLGFDFELKGGTSLSKGYKIIHRFSEDIDIHIKPPADQRVQEDPSKVKEEHIRSRKMFYDWLANEIKIDGIVKVERDEFFDDSKYRSGGIRLFYDSLFDQVVGLKQGILLEAGFDVVTPNRELTISSWALDYVRDNTNVAVIDNCAYGIKCYHPGYTFVEKLQTVATKFRQEMTSGKERPNYMRQYYDLYCLLEDAEVTAFITTEAYLAHKKDRFPPLDFSIPVKVNQAFLLDDADIRNRFEQRYIGTMRLYYKGQPNFDEILARLREFIDIL